MQAIYQAKNPDSVKFLNDQSDPDLVQKIRIKKRPQTQKNQRFEVIPKCRRPESNRYGRLVPQDFKSCASASSATAAYLNNEISGTYRARTYDPLLVRQMLSQLS